MVIDVLARRSATASSRKRAAKTVWPEAETKGIMDNHAPLVFTETTKYGPSKQFSLHAQSATPAEPKRSNRPDKYNASVARSFMYTPKPTALNIYTALGEADIRENQAQSTTKVPQDPLV